MTKIQVRFRLERPLDDGMMSGISDVQAVYGIDRVQVAPALDALTVDYDASRLREADVEALLRRKGLAIA